MTASRLLCALVNTASVATTTSVVASRALPLVRTASAVGGNVGGSPRPPNSLSCSYGAAQNHGPRSTSALPVALTATIAPTTWPPAVCAEAEPMPPLQLTVTAPVPAPALPSAKSTSAAAVAA